MAVDFTQSRDKYNDRCKWYKNTSVDKMKLTHDAVAEGVFYSRDTVPLVIEEVAQGNIKRKQHTLTVETPDTVGDLSTDDYVLYVDGELWLVRKVTSADNDGSKEFSKRPSVMTTIELRR